MKVAYASDHANERGKTVVDPAVFNVTAAAGDLGATYQPRAPPTRRPIIRPTARVVVSSFMLVPSSCEKECPLLPYLYHIYYFTVIYITYGDSIKSC